MFYSLSLSLSPSLSPSPSLSLSHVLQKYGAGGRYLVLLTFATSSENLLNFQSLKSRCVLSFARASIPLSLSPFLLISNFSTVDMTVVMLYTVCVCVCVYVCMG